MDEKKTLGYLKKNEYAFNFEKHLEFKECLAVKKAQQRLFFLRQLKKLNLPPAHMTQFYSAVIELVLCSSKTVWFGSASKSDIRRLQRTVRTAERIIGVHLPSFQDLYNSKVKKRAGNIINRPLLPRTHPVCTSPLRQISVHLNI